MRRRRKSEAKEPTLDELIAAKLKVLREFYVVDRRNEKEVEAKLRKVVLDNPTRDRNIVLEQAVLSMVMSK